MKRHLFCIILTVAIAPVALGASFKIIVNNGVTIDSISKKAASDLFMKRVTKWESGVAVVPVDRDASAAVREEFSKTIHGKPAAAVKSYWNQQIFGGRGVPPVEKPSDAEVIALVRSQPGSIGYVSDETPVNGVRVVRVE